MNRHGETFEDQPPHGEYWACPLYDCKYKLATSGVPMPGLISTWIEMTPMSLPDLVRERMTRRAVECDRLMREHLKTHEMHEFARTVERIQSNARAEVQKISKLVSLVFYATATQEGE